MSSLLNDYKPRASARTELLAAALLWTVVGALLLFFGARCATAAVYPCRVAVILLAVVVGTLKAEYVLARAAGRAVERIRARGDGACLGGFLAARTWLLVAVMMGAGYAVRRGLAPLPVVGVLYVAIGVALLLAARRFWTAWYR